MKKLFLLFFVVSISFSFAQSHEERLIEKEQKLIESYEMLYKLKQKSFLIKALDLTQSATAKDIRRALDEKKNQVKKKKYLKTTLEKMLEIYTQDMNRYMNPSSQKTKKTYTEKLEEYYKNNPFNKKKFELSKKDIINKNDIKKENLKILL